MQFIDPNAPVPEGTLRLVNTVDVLTSAEEVGAHRSIALEFPKWTDGRAYSQAALLRGRLRFEGELIATGDVMVDMLPLLQRCGFDRVQLRPDQSLASAKRALGFFRSHYQTVPPERAAATPALRAAAPAASAAPEGTTP